MVLFGWCFSFLGQLAFENQKFEWNQKKQQHQQKNDINYTEITHYHIYESLVYFETI